MNKAIKRIAMLFVVCGLAVSVSFGVDIMDNREDYQKLKTEVEVLVASVEKSRNIVIDEDSCNNALWKNRSDMERLCELKNVLAFFDEIRITNAEIKNPKGLERLINLKETLLKVGEMPRFKNDSGIYSYVKFVRSGADAMSLGGKFDGNFWEKVWQKWKETKIEFGISDATIEVWKQAGEIGRIE